MTMGSRALNDTVAGSSDLHMNYRGPATDAVVRVGRYLLGACYVLAAAYLCVIALRPPVRQRAPAMLQWFGAPGSFLTIAVMLAFPAAILVLWKLAGRSVFAANPVLVLAAMATSAVAMGMSAFWMCHDAQSPFFAPLSWTLALFVGAVEPRYGGSDGTCAHEQMPVALELARLLAISTTLTTALTAALTLFKTQLDRIAIWRGRSLTVIVGVDDETVSLVRAVASRMEDDATLVVITAAPDRRVVEESRAAGARIRVAALRDPKSLAQLRLWKRLDRLYLLSEDPVQNENRLATINATMDAFGDKRLRLPLTVRIDDPWQAEVWRRSFIESVDEPGSGDHAHKRRWVADAVGRYEVTAAKLVRHITRRSGSQQLGAPPQAVILCGLHPLTYAVSSELAQLCREQDLYAQPGVRLPAEVVILAKGAPGFVEDHDLRQRRMSPGHLTITLRDNDVEPTVESIAAVVSQHGPRHCTIVLTDPNTANEGTRLAARFQGLRIYQASTSAVSLPEESIVGRLFTFPINMELDEGAPQDVWERAAELIHEHYSVGQDRTEWSARPWAKLDPILQQQNRREVVNTLWLVEDEGHTWNTLENPPAPALPVGFRDMPPLKQLEWLGFDADTVARMIWREHEDWKRCYEDAGWRRAATRCPSKKHHEGLLSWPELQGHDADLEREGVTPPDDRLYTTRAQRSLASTLVNLRVLGYRSIPKPASQWQRYRRTGEVRAEQRCEPWQWTTETGEKMRAQAGDWMVTDDAGRERSVAADIFEATHKQIGPGRYERTGVFLARQAVTAETVVTAEGDALARQGDWIVQGQFGERWPVPADQFLATYEGPIDDDSSDGPVPNC